MPRALIIVEDGVDDLELYYAKHRLLEEGYQVVTASHTDKTNHLVLGEDGKPQPAPRHAKGKYGIEHPIDTTYHQALQEEWDIIVVPGGRSPERARLHREAVELVRRQAATGRLVIAICHGPQLLASAIILKGKKVTGHPGIADDLRNAGAIYTGAPAELDPPILTIRHTTTIHAGFRLITRSRS